MKKHENYEHPDFKLIDFSLEGVICASFNVGNGDESVPKYEEEIFEW